MNSALCPQKELELTKLQRSKAYIQPFHESKWLSSKLNFESRTHNHILFQQNICMHVFMYCSFITFVKANQLKKYCVTACLTLRKYSNLLLFLGVYYLINTLDFYMFNISWKQHHSWLSLQFYKCLFVLVILQHFLFMDDGFHIFVPE